MGGGARTIGWHGLAPGLKRPSAIHHLPRACRMPQRHGSVSVKIYSPVALEIAVKAHIVLAHPEPKSFNGNLARIAEATLSAQGYSVTLSDLYAMGFDPCEGPRHYEARHAPARFDTQSEQYHASK